MDTCHVYIFVYRVDVLGVVQKAAAQVRTAPPVPTFFDGWQQFV